MAFFTNARKRKLVILNGNALLSEFFLDSGDAFFEQFIVDTGGFAARAANKMMMVMVDILKMRNICHKRNALQYATFGKRFDLTVKGSFVREKSLLREHFCEFRYRQRTLFISKNCQERFTQGGIAQ